MDDDDVTQTMDRPSVSAGGSLDQDQPRQTQSTSRPTSFFPQRQFSSETGYETAEEEGDVGAAGGEVGAVTGAHEEVSQELSEAAEEFAEASTEQLAESSADSPESDLEAVEGYAPLPSSESQESGGEALEFLPEAGSADGIGGGESERQEFFPILAALVPTLVSAAGPALAKGVMARLRPRSKSIIARLAKMPKPAVPGGQANLLDLIARLLSSGQLKPGGESSTEADQAVASEAAAALEVIIGTDDRLRITATKNTPWRRYCALRITFPSGRTYRGTGFLIGRRAVATAGHCVYLHAEGGWARKIEVIPGMNGNDRPFGSTFAVSMRSVGGWVNGKQPASDYGCVILPQGAFGGRSLGKFGFAALSNAQLLACPAVLAGYPGDKPFAQLWGMSRKIKTVGPKTLIYDIDTMGGQSGAPVYIKHKGSRTVVGIHNYGAGTGNSATRVTKPVFDRLKAWSAIN